MPTYKQKVVPTKKIVVTRKVNIAALKKLILLSNHFIQYHVIPYEETIMEANDESIIYFEPNTDKMEYEDNLRFEVLRLNRFILICCNSKSISKSNMEIANGIWDDLKAVSKA